VILRSSRWDCEILRNTLQKGDDTEHLVIRKWSVDGQEGILVDEDDNYECSDNPDGDHHQLKQRNRRD